MFGRIYGPRKVFWPNGATMPDAIWLYMVQVSFEIADITTCEMAKESYDVVYSRDTILHIHNKPALFKR